MSAAEDRGADGADQTLLLRTHGEKHVSAAPSAPPHLEELDLRELDDQDFIRGDPAEWATTTADPLSALLDLFARSRPAWHDKAACRDSGVDFTATGKTERARAFDICGGCPVRDICAEWAIEVGDDVAVLGGLDPAARRRMKRVS